MDIQGIEGYEPFDEEVRRARWLQNYKPIEIAELPDVPDKELWEGVRKMWMETLALAFSL